MAGHNKWSKIKHRKAAVEKKKTKVWSKVSKAIMVAARHGGPDPASNLSLRYAIDEARYANMPRDTIERAIKKGAGEKDGEDWAEIRYEGYGPGGVAIIIEALTNNRTRTVNDVRLALSDHGGNLGNTGCVGFMFEQRGQIVVSARTPVGPVDSGALMDAAIAAGATDVDEPDPEDPDGAFVIACAPADYLTLKESLETASFAIADAQLAFVPTTKSHPAGEAAKVLADLVDALEDLDDIQKVWTNAESLDA